VSSTQMPLLQSVNSANSLLPQPNVQQHFPAPILQQTHQAPPSPGQALVPSSPSASNPLVTSSLTSTMPSPLSPMQPLNPLNSMPAMNAMPGNLPNASHQLNQQMQQQMMNGYGFPYAQYSGMGPLSQIGQLPPSLSSPSGLGSGGGASAGAGATTTAATAGGGAGGGGGGGVSPQSGQQGSRGQMPVSMPMHQYYYPSPFAQSMYPYSGYPQGLAYYSSFQPSTTINTTTGPIGHSIPQPKPTPLPKPKKVPKEKKIKQKVPKPPKQPKGKKGRFFFIE
jgi:hypothetical protein